MPTVWSLQKFAPPAAEHRLGTVASLEYNTQAANVKENLREALR